MALNAHETGQLRAALQEAVVKCSERCLYQSAKWAAELLTSLPTPDDNGSEPEDSQMTEAADGTPPIIVTGNRDPDEAQLEAKEINQYLLAKSFFDCREFDRCAAVFLPETVVSSLCSAPPKPTQTTPSSAGKGKGKAKAQTIHKGEGPKLPKLSQKSLFLALYARYMSGEKKKDEESEMVMGPQDGGNTINKQLMVIARLLESWFKERTTENGDVIGSEGWLEYLYGMVLAKDKSDEEAMKFLLRSVHAFPLNWGCWLEIASLTPRKESLNKTMLLVPPHIMTFIFHVHTSLELYSTSPALASSLQDLLSIFPTSSFLLTCSALLSYHQKDFAQASSSFGALLAAHPHRLDSLDHYSNILYVMNQRPKLSFLAHLATSIDAFRPETCVIVGNYYSLLSQHEKAVNYFRRALTLDRNCLSAWTLMGHEYVEMKNTHAAIESYRRAVDVNRRDYRAWYGLGQTYEVLEMATYALWYYKRAAGLRPWDGKMWQAVGSCLQKMGRDIEGIKALKRALLAESYYDSSNAGSESFGSGRILDRGQMDPEILLQIAGMYERLEDAEQTKEYMELAMAQEEALDVDEYGDGDGGRGTGVTAATSKARMWLAKYAMRHQDWERAMLLATELCHDGVEVEEAKALVREVRARVADDTPERHQMRHVPGGLGDAWSGG